MISAIRVLSLTLLLVISACRSEAPSARTAAGHVDSTLTVAAVDPAPDALGAPWFQQVREIDLTGDGKPDTVVIRAEGRSSDSLRVTLTFIVDGKERWRERWSSDYMLIDPPSFPDGETSRDTYVREGLLRTLRGVSVEPFDATNYALMADPVDSMIVRQPPREEITLGYGYETSLGLAWDAGSKSFRNLWACC